jgi:hypothetical protein
LARALPLLNSAIGADAFAEEKLPAFTLRYVKRFVMNTEHALGEEKNRRHLRDVTKGHGHCARSREGPLCNEFHFDAEYFWAHA